MSNILILGIGNAQVDVIKAYRELGHTVHACSYTDTGPGKKYCDFFKLIDIRDFEGVREYAREYDIDIIYSVGSDIAMPTVSKVSEQLNLPSFASYKVSEICNSKDLLRDLIGNDSVYNIKYQTLSDIKEDIFIQYPFIMKPVDSQGQRGVVLVKDKEGFKRNFEQSLGYSSRRKVIIEEFIKGEEVSVNSYVLNGKVVFLIVSDRKSWSQFDGGIVHKHIFPSKINDSLINHKIKNLVKDIISKLNIENGPVYFQLKIVNSDPKLIEVTPRLDGCHLWRLIKYYTSVDLLNITINHLLGKEPGEGEFIIQSEDGVYELEFICEVPNSIVFNQRYDVSNYLYLESYYSEGQKVREVNGKFEKIGYFISKNRINGEEY